MKEIKFYKYQGTGNDFVIVDQMKKQYDLSPPKIKEICDRRFGIGADGLMFLRPHSKYDFEMVYYNSDGQESTMCGNGGRCIADLYFNKYGKGKEVNFLAIDGSHRAIKKKKSIALEMKDIGKIKRDGEAYVLDTGSPHYVMQVEDVNEIPVEMAGATIRYSEHYILNGINVNFLEISNNEIKVRTYERGVEGETLSCGTGVTACAIVSNLISNGKLGKKVTIKTKGGELQVTFDKKGKTYKNVWLQGPAITTYKGIIKI